MRRDISEHLKAGDRVAWNTPQGETTGRVKRKLNTPGGIKGHHVAASPDDPQYLVVSDRRGADAAHKPDALRKL